MTSKEKFTRADQERKALDIYEKALMDAAQDALDDKPGHEQKVARAMAMAEILDAMGVTGAKHIQAQAGVWLALQLHTKEVRSNG